jgi:ParB-like nuclease domain
MEGMAKVDVFELPVLPAADVFPMMADDELQELADDIKANGLNQPIVTAEVDGKRVLVDGRNRRAACKLAGVEPQIRHLNGEDPKAYVLSADVHRRNLTPGQRAMAVAMIRPEPEQGKGGGRGKKKVATSGDVSGVAQQRISDARAVLRYSRKLAEAVMSGDKPLKAALAEARQSQGDVLNARSRLAKLRDDRPDLAELVVNEALSLDDAIKTAKAEAEEHKQQRWAATMNIIDGLRPFDHAPETAGDHIAFYDPALAESRGETVTPARIRRASEYLAALADAMEDLQ